MKNNDNFYCLNYLHSFRTKNKLESHERTFENKDFCNVNMTSHHTKMLQFDQYQKYYKEQLIIYVYLECIIEKTNRCKNNLVN